MATAIATDQTILVVGGVKGVMHTSQRMIIACGRSAKDAAPDGPLVKASKLEEIAARPVAR